MPRPLVQGDGASKIFPIFFQSRNGGQPFKVASSKRSCTIDESRPFVWWAPRYISIRTIICKNGSLNCGLQKQLGRNLHAKEKFVRTLVIFVLEPIHRVEEILLAKGHYIKSIFSWVLHM